MFSSTAPRVDMTVTFITSVLNFLELSNINIDIDTEGQIRVHSHWYKTIAIATSLIADDLPTLDIHLMCTFHTDDIIKWRFLSSLVAFTSVNEP